MIEYALRRAAVHPALDVCDGGLTQNQKADMNTYESPTITELGSVADFTRQDGWDIDFDGRLAHDRNGVPGPFGGGS